MPNSNSDSRLITELRQNLLGLITIAVVLLVVFGLVRLSSRVRAHNSPVPADDLSGSDHHLYAATYQTTGGRSSTLGLNNTLNHDLSAQITLFNKHGQSLSTPAMNITLGAHKNHGFNISDWTAGHDGFEEGSLLVSYHGRSMTLGAQETVADATRGLNFDVHLSEYDDFMSSRVEGLWWGLDHQCEALVFIANTEDSLTTVTPFFYVAGVQYQGDPIILQSHESTSLDIEQSLHKLHVNGDITRGGISLTYTNETGAVAVVGVIENKHSGFSTTMRFIDASGQKTTTLHGASLLIGKANPDAGFSSDTRFTPHVFVRNTTAQPVTVNPLVRYTLFDQPNIVNLPEINLTAYQVREVDLTAVVNAIGNNPVADSGVEIEHSGQPGAVMAYAAGVSQNGKNVIDVPIKDPKNMPFQGGSYPWSLEGDNRAALHVKNVDTPSNGLKRQFMVKLYFDGGEYDLPLQQVEAGQTGEVDIRKLRDDQVKDVLGNVIPLSVTSGQLAWSGRANRGAFIGRLVEYNPVNGTSSSFSCPLACLCSSGFLSGSATPVGISDFVGHQHPLDALETDQDCNHDNLFTYTIYDAAFSSSDTDVVTVDGYTATLVGPGEATITASWDAESIEQICSLASDGECVDARCPSTTISNPIANTEVEATPKIDDLSPALGPIASSVSVSITGSGFGNSPSVSAGTGITVTIQDHSDTSISVSLAISADTAGGDHGITVTANGQQSNSVNFFVQIPTKLRRDDLGQLQNEDGGCGATRLLNYTVLDQESEAAPISTNGVISETISDQNSTVQGIGCTASPSQNMDHGAFPDRIGYLIPTCPSAFTVTCTQSFKVTLGGHDYNLSSHNAVSMGRNADGSKFVNITLTQ